MAVSERNRKVARTLSTAQKVAATLKTLEKGEYARIELPDGCIEVTIKSVMTATSGDEIAFCLTKAGKIALIFFPPPEERRENILTAKVYIQDTP